MKAALIGSICTLVGLVFAIYVYVDTSDGVTVDDKNLWVREEGKLLGPVLGYRKLNSCSQFNLRLSIEFDITL